jgi:hypothetical protein
MQVVNVTVPAMSASTRTSTGSPGRSTSVSPLTVIGSSGTGTSPSTRSSFGSGTSLAAMSTAGWMATSSSGRSRRRKPADAAVQPHHRAEPKPVRREAFDGHADELRDGGRGHREGLPPVRPSFERHAHPKDRRRLPDQRGNARR